MKKTIKLFSLLLVFAMLLPGVNARVLTNNFCYGVIESASTSDGTVTISDDKTYLTVSSKFRVGQIISFYSANYSKEIENAHRINFTFKDEITSGPNYFFINYTIYGYKKETGERINISHGQYSAAIDYCHSNYINVNKMRRENLDGRFEIEINELFPVYKNKVIEYNGVFEISCPYPDPYPFNIPNGDVNCDKTVNVMDYLFAKKVLANCGEFLYMGNEQIADVNWDGFFNVKDLLVYQKYFIGEAKIL